MLLRSKNVSPVISYKNLRRVIGIFGILLPLVCYLNGILFASTPLQPSISAYYYTNARDFFVGLLVAVGLFLMTYKGYETIDIVISTATGIAGIGVAAFPCMPPDNILIKTGIFQLPSNISNTIHLICAIIFFLLLAVNSIFIFTLTDKTKPPTANKKKRNIIYIICGCVILAMMILLLIVMLVPSLIPFIGIVFVLESICLVAFGISWLVKGETLFKDAKK